MCVGPDTIVITLEGRKKISELVGKETPVKIWNGREYISVIIEKTHKSVNLTKVKFSDGRALLVSDDHKWFIEEEQSQDNVKLTTLTTTRLDTRDVLSSEFNFPLVQGKDTDFKHAYTHGFFCGRGSYEDKEKKESPYILFKEENDPNIENLASIDKVATEDFRGNISQGLKVFLDPSIQKRYVLPEDCTIEIKLKWLAGLIDSIGLFKTERNADEDELKISSSASFLRNVQAMLESLMCQSVVQSLHKEEGRFKKQTPKSNRAEFKKKNEKLYELILRPKYLFVLKQLGLELLTKKCKFSPRGDVKDIVKIASIHKNQVVCNAYFFRDYEENAGVFNGVYCGSE